MCVYQPDIRLMKLDYQFLAKKSENMMQAGGYYSLQLITTENH